MANGNTAHENIAAVKSHINSLEVSPSHHSPTSPVFSGGTKAVGKGVHHKTGSMASKGKSTRPNPRGSAIRIGKKSHSFNKSQGR